MFFIDFSRTDLMVHLRIIQRVSTPFTPTNPVLPILGVIHLIQVKFENRDFLCSDLELYPRVRRTPHTLSACGPDGLFIGRRKMTQVHLVGCETPIIRFLIW